MGKVYGIGINDLGKDDIKLPDGSLRVCYTAWRNMLRRVTNGHKAYIGVTVCEDWLTYSNFKMWHDVNYKDGWELDKDILAIGEGKVYSPETCCYVPKEINLLITKKPPKELPVGVSFDKDRGKYIVHISIKGRQKFLGRYDSLDVAAMTYLRNKHRHVLDTVTEYRHLLPKRVRFALQNMA